MSGSKEKKSTGLGALLRELGDEVEEEKKAAMDPKDRKLDDIAREALRLERDMTIPGSSLSESARIERLMQLIESKEF